MSNSNQDGRLTTTEVFGAARDFNRVVNAAIDRACKVVLRHGIFGVSASDLMTLSLVLDFESDTSAPLEIAEKGTMDKGAFNRCLKSLEENGFVVLKRDEEKIVSIELTNQGRKAATTFQGELNNSVQELVMSGELRRVAGLYCDKR